MRIQGTAKSGKANKRELILAAAQEVFFEKGYHTATSEEIAKRAGVGKGTIYQYFESKQEIFFEMQRLYVKQYEEKLVALIDGDSSFTENLRRIVHFHLDHFHDLAQYHLRFLSNELPKPDIQKHVTGEGFPKGELQKAMEALIVMGQQRGELREMDVQLAMAYISGTGLGMACLFGKSEVLSDETKAYLEEEIMQLILHGLDNQA
jgi:TetR/AcrR family fatty acid metabolism transcriptional regulator